MQRFSYICSMEEKPKRTRKKAEPAKKVAEPTPTKEEALKVSMEVIKGGESEEENLQELLADKIYSYMERNGKVFRKRSFKYKDRTEADIKHFTKTIADAWDAAPIDSRINFMLMAFPAMRSFLKKRDPELLMVLLHDPEKAGGAIN